MSTPTTALSLGRAQDLRKAEQSHRRPLWVSLAWVALVGSLLPIGINSGLPFQLSPADVLLPLASPIVFFLLPRPATFRLLLLTALASVFIVLVWAILDDAHSIPSIQSWLFFWKSWVAALLAYGLVARSPRPVHSIHRILGFVAWSMVLLVTLALAGWVRTGQVLSSATSAGGIDVTGFSAGSWDFPISLYGYGQVNVTASLLALAGPILAYRAMCTIRVSQRIFWLAWIPASWWLVVNSGSRGAVVTAGLFVALLPLASEVHVARVSVAKLALTLGLAGIVLTQGQVILEASPKYAQTMQDLSRGDASAVTSGRAEINALSMDDIQRSPLVGTAFGDFYRFHTSMDTQWVNMSPHNTLIGPLHKMGIPLGLAYLTLVAKTLPLRRLRGLKGTEFLTLPLTLPLVVGSFLVGDALTTPVLAATIFTISGALMAGRDREPGLDDHALAAT